MTAIFVEFNGLYEIHSVTATMTLNPMLFLSSNKEIAVAIACCGPLRGHSN